MPSTMIPSGAPSMTGWVATVTAATVATTELDEDTITDFATNVADFYGVDPTEVSTSTIYESSGSLSMSIPDDLSEAELTDVITSSIAESLGVHPQNVEVNVDMETGEVEFVITSDSFANAAGISFDLDNYQYQEEIIASIETSIPVSVETFDSSEDVTATLEFTIDADSASNDLTQAAWLSEQLLSDFDVTVQSKNCFLLQILYSITHKKESLSTHTYFVVAKIEIDSFLF